MPNSANDKIKVVIGIATAWIISFNFILSGQYLSRKHNWFGAYPDHQILALALLPAVFALAIGIGWAAKTRHFSQNIDGSPPAEGTPLDITLRYIQNTLEQLVLFAAACFCLHSSAPEISRTVLPILGLWFFITRMMFWFGYKRALLSRAIGFASTFHVTLVMLAISTTRLLF